MSQITATDHIAVLRERAREAGVEGFRMLRREDLLEQLRDKGVEVGEGSARGRKSAESDRLKAGRRRGGRDRSGTERREEAPTNPAAGVLDVTPRGHGFLRSGLQPADDDVYVSASQIRRCVLRAGDLVTGPAREPRRDERYPALVHVDEVNGAEPIEERPSFDEITPARPSRALDMDASVLGSEIQAGERVLIVASAGPERFVKLRELTAALAERLGSDVIVLLIDVPPEELADWQAEESGATVAALAADSSPAAAGRVARLALEHAKRRAEAGGDAVLIVDSLSRLAVFEEDVAGVKRLFGAGRQLGGDDAGSVTVIATTLGEDEAHRAVKTTETSLLEL